MAACHCCCRGKPRSFPSFVTLWKLRISDLEEIWWQDRGVGTPSGTNVNAEVFGEYCVDCGPTRGLSSSWQAPGSFFTPLSDWPDVAAHMLIPNITTIQLEGITFSSDGAEACFFDSASGGKIYRFTTLTGNLVSQIAYSAPGAIRQVYGIPGGQDLIVAYVSNVDATTNLGVWDAGLNIGTFVPYSTFAPTSTNSYQPQADHFAVTQGGNHYLYDSALDEISTGADTATESIVSANSTHSLARDTTAATYRLLSNSGFGEVWNSAYAGGYTPFANYWSHQIDASGVYVLEQNGTARRVRKLSAADGTESWSTAVATSAPHRQLLYDPDEDILLLLGTTSTGTGTDAVLAYDGSTGTLVASHDMGDFVGVNKTSSLGAIADGFLYVACPTGNVP